MRALVTFENRYAAYSSSLSYWRPGSRCVRDFLILFLFLSSVLLFSLSLFRCQISLAWVTTSLEITHKVVLHNLDINHITSTRLFLSLTAYISQGMHLTGVHLTGCRPHRHAPHRCASQMRTSYRRASHRHVSQRRTSQRLTSHRRASHKHISQRRASQRHASQGRD
jgi:hypothetical protein